jgi:hypothetical protein
MQMRILNLKQRLLFTLFAGLLAGVYGMLHDQLSYTISREYFTAFKFYQFHYLDFHQPERIFAAMIGFTATFGVGLFVGWILAWIGIRGADPEPGVKKTRRALLLALSVAVFTGLAGMCIGYVTITFFPFSEFLGWEKMLGIEQLKNFAIVGTMHNSGYIGGLLGLRAGVIYLIRRRKSRHNGRQEA